MPESNQTQSTAPDQSHIDRRAALSILATGAAATALAPALTPNANADSIRSNAFDPAIFGWDFRTSTEYSLPKLPYAYDALEPAIDAQTMQIHHSKHHAGYVRGLNNALKKLAEMRNDNEDPALIKHWSRELAFHGGGHINHSIFWHTMAPQNQGGGGRPPEPLATAINQHFGSFDQFKAHFAAAARAVEASGWAWLVVDRFTNRLFIQQMEKQQNLLLTGAVPILGIDVWEHAYYLKYQNRRAEYVENFFSIINWNAVNNFYKTALGLNQ